MNLLIIRHAESVENAAKYAGFYQDPRPYDAVAAHWLSREVVGLTPRGFRQAAWLASTLPLLIDDEPKVFTSTYRRAIDTAAIALPSMSSEAFQQTRLLDEQHYGDATYMTKRELYDAYPCDVATRREQKHLWCAPGGESLALEVSARVAEFVGLARAELQTVRTVIAFTHQSATMAFRSHLEDRPLADVVAEERTAKLPNAAILHYQLAGRRFVRTGTTVPADED